MITARSEIKYIVGTTSTTAATTGSLIYLSALAQDDTLSGRTGDRVRPVSMRVRVSMSDTSTNITRFIIIQDKLNYGAAPAVADVLSSANYNALINPIALANERFKVLDDFCSLTSTAGEQTFVHEKLYKLKGEISYTGIAGTSANGGKNAIYCLVICLAGTPTYDLKQCMAYTDA